MNVTVTIPEDAEALQMLDNLAQNAAINGKQAQALLALRGWIGQLPERLGVAMEPAEAA
jgi:hypothetical protein